MSFIDVYETDGVTRLGTGQGSVNGKNATISQWDGPKPSLKTDGEYTLHVDETVHKDVICTSIAPITTFTGLASLTDALVGSGVQYTLNVVNNSMNIINAALFQWDPNIGLNGFPVVWFSKAAYPSTRLKFVWTLDYNFVWGLTGIPQPGVIFDANQVIGADLQAHNETALCYDDMYKAFSFNPNPPAAGQPGRLQISQGSNIPPDQASVGIGMSGSATFVRGALADMTFVFSPHPVYYIVAGDYLQGQMLDASQITSEHPQVSFPPDVYSMTAILNADGTWTILPTPEVDRLHLTAKEKNPDAKWGILEE